MIRDVLCSIDYSICAEISLVMFLAIFAAVSLRALATSSRQANLMANIPLQDNIDSAQGNWETPTDA